MYARDYLFICCPFSFPARQAILCYCSSHTLCPSLLLLVPTLGSALEVMVSTRRKSLRYCGWVWWALIYAATCIKKQ